MNKLNIFLSDIGQSFAHLCGVGVVIERWDLTSGPLRFFSEKSPAGDRQYWGLGLHVIVSPLRVHPQSN